MLDFFDYFFGMMSDLVTFLDGVTLFGVVSLWDFSLAMLFLGLATTVFWKGARS